MYEDAKDAGKGKKIDMRGDKNMPAMMNARPGSGVVTNNVANGMLKDPGAVKVLMSSWSNFNFSCTDPKRWDRALAKVPFFVHLVTNPSEMTQFADVVLPATLNCSEGTSIITNMGNLHGYATIQQPAGRRLWDVKQEETEVMWLLAAKLKEKGFPNLFDYYSKEFKDPENGKAPTSDREFSEIAWQMPESCAPNRYSTIIHGVGLAVLQQLPALEQLHLRGVNLALRSKMWLKWNYPEIARLG